MLPSLPTRRDQKAPQKSRWPLRAVALQTHAMLERARTNATSWTSLVAMAVLAACSGVAAVPSRGLQRGSPAPLANSAGPLPARSSEPSAVPPPAPADESVAPAVVGDSNVIPAKEVTEAPSNGPSTPPANTGAVATAVPPAPEVPAATTASAAAPATAGEAELREQLATAADPVPAAHELVARLGADERFDEALAVVVAARQRSDSLKLGVLQASVLRDLGQRHAALAELLRVRSEVGDAGFAVALQLEVAELQWLEGQKADAVATLGKLRSALDDRVPAATRARIERLASEIGASAVPRTIAGRDLLGNLRGAPSATARLAALDRLMREGGEPELQQRAIQVAAGDEASSVRARAVQLATPAAADREQFCRIALADPAALVRRFAVARTVELLGDAAARMLLDRLAVETDEALFVAIDAALSRLLPGNEPHPLAGGDANSRREVVAGWQRVLEGK